MTHFLQIDGNMSLGQLVIASRLGGVIELSEAARERVAACRSKLESFVRGGRVIYGVNTSVGGFVHMLLPTERAPELQNNLINAVATNVGNPFGDHTTRAIMLARIQSLVRGNSAISIENLEKLVALFNSGVIPFVPEKGSLGTSGDLGPLAAIALVGTGQWKALFHGQLMSGIDALRSAGLEPMQLSFKEGLALINGTSAMVAVGAMTYLESRHLFDQYLRVSALSIEGLAAKTKPFDPRVHRLKPHPGQQYIAESLWRMLTDSRLAVSEADVERTLALQQENLDRPASGGQPIEDAYSIRCTPQVLGPVKDSLDSISAVLENELNSSNDNPLLIPEEDEVFHNGHFHGQYVAMAMDHLVIDLVTICNLSDRRTDRFLTEANSSGLPGFLCNEGAGLRLGLMGGQFMSTSLTAENRSLAMPVSIQSLTSTGDFQDIVSLGLVAARRAREVLCNSRYIVAFELICACQAADIRGSGGLSSEGRAMYDLVRESVPFLDHDVVLTDYVERLVRSLFVKEPEQIHQTGNPLANRVALV